MYVCEECGTEDGPIADCEGGAMCRPCAALHLDSEVKLTGVKFGGVVVTVFWSTV